MRVGRLFKAIIYLENCRLRKASVKYEKESISVSGYDLYGCDSLWKK